MPFTEQRRMLLNRLLSVHSAMVREPIYMRIIVDFWKSNPLLKNSLGPFFFPLVLKIHLNLKLLRRRS